MRHRVLPSVLSAGLRSKSAMKSGLKSYQASTVCVVMQCSLSLHWIKSYPGSSPRVSASGTVPARAAVVVLRDPKPSAFDTFLVSKRSVALAGSSCWSLSVHISVVCPAPQTDLGESKLTVAFSQPHCALSDMKSYEAALIQKKWGQILVSWWKNSLFSCEWVLHSLNLLHGATDI